MTPPDKRFTASIQPESMRDRNKATPLLSSSHQSAEPMNTPPASALAAK